MPRSRRSQSAPASKRASFTRIPTRTDSHRRLPAQQRAALRQRRRSPARSSSCSTPSTTATTTTWRSSTRSAQFEFSPKFNIWFGRFLPPSDRANLYGPYYAHHWAVFTDGVQDGYPFIFQGRDNGAVYWGQFGKVKLSAGAFDGASATGDDTLLGAGRIQVDFWDPEPGYYLNGTFYGDKNILAIGGAGQVQGSDKSAYNVDFLLENEGRRRRGVLGRSRVGQVRPARRLQRALRHRRRRLHPRARFCFPQLVGDRPVRGPRQVRAGAIPRGPHAARRRLRPEDHRAESQLRHQAVQRARDDVLQGHALRRRAAPNSMQIGVGLQIQM